MGSQCTATTAELQFEVVPASLPVGRCPLVLLHGWGHTRACWQPLVPYLAQEQDLYLIDLPGFGENAHSAVASLDKVLSALERLLPESSILLGWSLGGHIALELAVRCPHKIAGVATLATNSCFVAREDWPHAMPQKIFEAFSAQFRAAPAATLKRFCALQAQGDSEGRGLLKALRAQCPAPELHQQEQWQQALGWLAQFDHRGQLPTLPMPLLHLFGQEDALVPAAAAEVIRSETPGEVVIFPDAGHAVHLTQSRVVAEQLQEFFSAIKPTASSLAPKLDKQRMARSFSRAAGTYDSVAHVQVRVGEQLLERLPANELAAPVLDLGCGTGFCTQRLVEANYSVTALDIAEGMLGQAQQKLGAEATWVCADAERLPFRAGAFQGVVSSLTVQWSEQLSALFAGVADVIKPGGWLLFSTLGPATLCELREAWRTVDGYAHVNDFASAQALRSALEAAGLQVSVFEEEHLVPRYEQAHVLMRELKALGAHNVNTQQNRGLTGPRYLREVTRAYEKFRGPDGKLPATYQVFYVLARKAVN
jgi:malonyl-CoA O-methyltransferase